jgi:Glu-tRNA(Gln) amidotransferase subunit E-like FAD-binding protein
MSVDDLLKAVDNLSRTDLDLVLDCVLFPHIAKDALDDAYKLMAEAQERETEALAWAEALIGDDLS